MDAARRPTPLRAGEGAATYSVETDFGGGFVQTKFMDAAGNTLGYMDSFSDDFGSGTAFMNANWEHLGGSWSNDFGSGSSIRIDQYDDDGNYTGYIEQGSETFEGQERSFEWNFDAAGNMTGGSETVDGREITLARIGSIKAKNYQKRALHPLRKLIHFQQVSQIN